MCTLYSFIYMILVIGCVQDNASSGIRSVSSSRLSRQVCGFKCKTSGECIDEDKQCDGNSDCLDESDETNDCRKIRCPSYLFRCQYGACINSEYVCDGKKNCRDNSDEMVPNCTMQVQPAKCKPQEFRCASGDCIDIDKKCDGIADCPDHSDETAATCSRLSCPGYTFRCAYGACVDGSATCNGISECFDNSDEDPKLCVNVTTVPKPPIPVIPHPPVFTSGQCLLPPHPTNGFWKVWSSNIDFQPGDHVNGSAVLNTECKKGYSIGLAPKLIICSESGWSGSFAQCHKQCPALVSSPTTNVTCTLRKAQINCAAAIPETIAKFTCAPFHEDLQLLGNSIRYCIDGTWDQPTPNCVPVCGKKNVNVKELIIGGQKVKRGNYPWQTPLYRRNSTGRFIHICGGSLVSLKVVVTAAHCVCNNKGIQLPKDQYKVAAGKYYREIDDPRDTEAQYSDIQEIFVAGVYKGNTLDYEGDLAILIIKDPFSFSEFVQLVCVDWDLSSYYENELLGANGTVTGWGYTIKGEAPSDELKEIELPYVPHDNCFNEIAFDYQKYVRSDKLCAGFINKGIGVCEGDSGGGLVFRYGILRRFYLRGIVSISPQSEGTCDTNQYALYTKVSQYIDLLIDKERQYHV